MQALAWHGDALGVEDLAIQRRPLRDGPRGSEPFEKKEAGATEVLLQR